MPFLQATIGGSSSLAKLKDVNITTPEHRDILTYDSSSSKWINSPTEAEITLTINGAKEDIITIYDSNNTLLGTCVFGSNQTSGQFVITVDVSYSDNWKFVSSIAKDTSAGTSNYIKYANITDTTSQTINVYPDGAIYWYGNDTLCDIVANTHGAYIRSKNQINITNYSYLKITRSNMSGDNYRDLGLYSNAWVNNNGTVYEVANSSDKQTITTQNASYNITSKTGNYKPCFTVYNEPYHSNSTGSKTKNTNSINFVFNWCGVTCTSNDTIVRLWLE